MSKLDFEDDRLKALFREGEGATNDVCPEPEALWEAAHGLGTAEQVGAITEHLAVCVDCTNAWQMTRLKPEADDEQMASVEPISRGRVWRRYSALAALLISGFIGVFLWMHRESDASQVRSAADLPIRSELQDRATVSRRDFRLHWRSAGLPDQVRYRVTVLAAQPLRSLVEIDSDTPEVLVSADHFAGLADGSMVFWRVSAYAGDGSRWDSGTFIQILGP